MGQGEEPAWSEKLIQRSTASELSTLKLKIGDSVKIGETAVLYPQEQMRDSMKYT